MDLIKANTVANLYCELTQLTPLDLDMSKHYRSLDLRIAYNKKFINYTLLYTKEQCVVIEVSAKRQAIVCSYNLLSKGSSDSHIRAVCQGHYK